MYLNPAFALAMPRLADRLDPPKRPSTQEWVKAKLGEHLWSKQVEIAESVRKHRFTACKAAHGPGKSYMASRIAAEWIDSHPVGEAFVVSSAPTHNQVQGIVWREIGFAHDKGDLPGYITQDAQWKIGSSLVGFGRKPPNLTDVNQAMSYFQGIHAKYLLVILDEAGGLPKWLFDAADSLVTNDFSRVLAIGNPDDPTSEFEKKCRPGSGWNVVHISAYDLPAFTGEVIPDDLAERLTSRQWVEERLERWGENSPLYISKVLGEFPETNDDTIVPWNYISQCRKTLALSQLPPAVATPTSVTGGVLGLDVARSSGKDENVLVSVYRGVVTVVKRWHESDLTKVAAVAEEELLARGPLWRVVVDGDGVGGGVVDILRKKLGRRKVVEFRGSKKAVHQPDRFANRRAEAYWGLREKLKDCLLLLPAEDTDDNDTLADDLASARRKKDAQGRILVEAKEEIKKRIGRSPDVGDAVMMAASIAPSKAALPNKKIDRIVTGEKVRPRALTHGILSEAL